MGPCRNVSLKWSPYFARPEGPKGELNLRVSPPNRPNSSAHQLLRQLLYSSNNATQATLYPTSSFLPISGVVGFFPSPQLFCELDPVTPMKLPRSPLTQTAYMGGRRLTAVGFLPAEINSQLPSGGGECRQWLKAILSQEEARKCRLHCKLQSSLVPIPPVWGLGTGKLTHGARPAWFFV